MINRSQIKYTGIRKNKMIDELKKIFQIMTKIYKSSNTICEYKTRMHGEK